MLSVKKKTHQRRRRKRRKRAKGDKRKEEKEEGRGGGKMKEWDGKRTAHNSEKRRGVSENVVWRRTECGDLDHAC